MIPVDWWTGKAKVNLDKLRGHGNSPEDPLLVEPRKCTSRTVLHAIHAFLPGSVLVQTLYVRVSISMLARLPPVQICKSLERCRCMSYAYAGYKTILDWLGLGYLIIGRDENDHEE